MITYFLHTDKKGYGLTYENFSLENNHLPFQILGGQGEGVAYLCGIPCPTKDGAGVFPVALLSQGDNKITYCEKEIRYEMPPLRRCGNIAYIQPMKTGELLSLFLSFAHTTASTLSQMENRLQSTEKQIAGYPLFRQ